MCLMLLAPADPKYTIRQDKVQQQLRLITYIRCFPSKCQLGCSPISLGNKSKRLCER